MKYFYYDNEGRVAMYSEGLNQTKFNVIELEVNEEKLGKISQGYVPFIRDGTLVLEESERISQDREKERQRLSVEKVRDDLKKATKIEELKEIISKLL